MARASFDRAMSNLRTLVAGHGLKEQGDGELLRAFARTGNQEAFAVLVKRHGPLVLAQCRRVLRQTEDAEDAFQATFVMLARQAAALAKRDSVTGWLHGVALRLSLNARRAALRRRAHEGQVTCMSPSTPEREASWREVQILLDKEIQRLPDSLREPFILCTLNGESHATVARRLSIKEGTVKSRLAEARKRLQQHLSRRGVELSAVLGAVAVASETATATAPIGLMAKAVEAGVAAAVSGGLPEGVVSAGAAVLVKGMVTSMMLKKIVLGAALVITAAGALGVSIAGIGTHASKAPSTVNRESAVENAAREKPVPTGTAEVQEATQKVERDGKADQKKSADNLNRIGRAMHSYHDDFRHLPPWAIMSNDKKPLLSWRVAILPYLGQGALFREFKLDEPWDSTHNKKLLARMPDLYSPPGINTTEPFSTFYQVFVGPGTAFEGPQGIPIQTITDGSVNVVMVAEAGEPVPWTKPKDLPYQRNKALPKLGGIFGGEFFAVACDGSVHAIRRDPDSRLMHFFIQRDDGNPFDLDDLAKK